MSGLYPCCLAIISKRNLMVFIDDTETNKQKNNMTNSQVKRNSCTEKYIQNPVLRYVPLNSSWSLSSDLTRGSQGLDLSLDFSY